ncbi:hypothetical protein KPH14_010787 [Odynerus spinipes]|uniref:Adenosine deaminase-like protein n=1 Tax=Odynerus spinipes TaxID=1348599 RepID=A0AAD9RHP6_9HYME|nr:hypothetical protein KPH14_010787 [Odynerus spinipes]
MELGVLVIKLQLVRNAGQRSKNYIMDLKNFCHKLPKIELHAHLNGSASPKTLRTLYKMQNLSKNNDINEYSCIIERHSSLEECFKMFSIAHSLTNNPEAIFIVTCNVIKEFMDDNVIYLELRSTPRAVEGKMTKEEYIEAMIRAIKNCKLSCPNIVVKLLISVDRKQGYEAASENIKLAMNYATKYPGDVVGIDLSGDPTKGSVFIELLKESRTAGLKIAAHCAEVPNEMESMDILNLKPERLGHCTCIHPNLGGTASLFEAFCQSRIPIELCLTSNVKCKTVPSYVDHHFKYFYEAGHPICIATDDKGVFDTSLSKEFEIASSVFGLQREDLIKICKSSIEYSFASNEEKQRLLSMLINFNSKEELISS